nr:FAD-dependent oxidoreductase [uncultured Desulfobacter sp.]
MKTRHKHYKTVIVGSGCAGLAAAATLSANGMETFLVDENPGLGGQLLRGKWPPEDLAMKLDLSKKKGFSLIRQLESLKHSRVEILPSARLAGIFNDNTLLFQDTSLPPGSQKAFEIKADHIILATGAREKYLPFPGWTLPGVMACGAAQILMKTHGVLPAKQTFVAGTSPLQMVLASQILLNKGETGGLFFMSSFQKNFEILPHFPNALPKILEGTVHQLRIMAKKVPIHYRTGIVEARGKDRLESLVIARLDRNGSFIPNTEKQISAQSLALGYGFAPNVELAAQAGCRLEYDKDRGGWVAQVSPGLETSVPGIFAAGEITGVAGGKKALIEGRMAALTLLGKNDPDLETQRKKELAYGRFFNRFCQIPSGAWDQIHDDTVICRCEDVTMGDIRKTVAMGCDESFTIKRITRSGMGRCQGRTCGSMIQDILSALTGKRPDQFGAASVRIPVKPLAVNAFFDKDCELS